MYKQKWMQENMRKLQQVPGIPKLADQGNTNVPLLGKQQFVLNHRHTHIYMFQKPLIPTMYIKYFLPH